MNWDDDRTRCRLCGACLVACPVMRLEEAQAQEEIVRLMAGAPTRWALQRCESCFACRLACPEGLGAGRVILDRWRAQAQQEGLPARARFFTPLSPLNFRTDIIEHLPPDERALVRQWDNDSPADEIFYPGCNWITAPYLAMTGILDGLTIRGALDWCCGEMYFRRGHFEVVRRIARDLTARYRDMGLKRMIIPCTAGYNMHTNVLPHFGAEFDFEVVHLLPWLLERLQKGGIAIRHPLEMTVTIQESCHAKFLGEAFMDIPRRILTLMGARIVEAPSRRERSLCCGIGGGFSHASAYHPYHLLRSTLRNVRMFRATGAEAVVTYCAGCLQMLATGQLAYPFGGQPIYHLLQLVQLAYGERPRVVFHRRALTSLWGTLRHQGPALLDPRRFPPDDPGG